jgi:hypothetical protein
VRGATVALAVTLLLLIAVASATVFFGYINTLRADMTSAGEQQMVELEIPPKLLALVCYSGYGYMYLSLSQGQDKIEGTAFYSVETDKGAFVKEGFINISMEEPTKVYLPVLFDTDEKYRVSLSGKKWEIYEYCWPVNDPYMMVYLPFDEGSGTTAEDFATDDDGSLSGRDDGTVYGANWTTGRIGSALEFDGDDDYVEVYSSNSLDLTDVGTIAVFYKAKSWREVATSIIQRGGSSGWCSNAHQPFTIFNHYTADCIFFSMCNSSDINDVRIQPRPPEGIWHHYAFTWNGSMIRSYLDGVQNSSSVQTLDMRTGNYDAWIGKAAAGAVNGTIDEVRIYSRALSQEEIEALYSAYTE